MQLMDNSNLSFDEHACGLKETCDANSEYTFRVISGAASVIGPRVCWEGTDIMRSKVENTVFYSATCVENLSQASGKVLMKAA